MNRINATSNKLMNVQQVINGTHRTVGIARIQQQQHQYHNKQRMHHQNITRNNRTNGGNECTPECLSNSNTQQNGINGK
jgi:hypothetical protein